MSPPFTEAQLAALRPLAAMYPTADLALAELSVLVAMQKLQAPTIHVISDVHGEWAKLRHVVNNASGSLRPLVEKLFAEKLSPQERHELLCVIYYPAETMRQLRPGWKTVADRVRWVSRTIRRQFAIVREFARTYRRRQVMDLLPTEYRELLEALVSESMIHRGTDYVDAMIEARAEYDRDLSVIRAVSRLIRNLAVGELIVAGDLGDRGPRIDRVIDFLMQQPNVTLLWGNHDLSWMGASLGSEPLIATVLRFSIRYARLAQLEAGYGISLEPLERLAREVYRDDPAERFRVKVDHAYDPLLLARMQKAVAILQFKTEGQLINRHPEWNLAHRNLLHRIDLSKGTVEIDGRVHPLLDRHLPTLDPAHPYALSKAEQRCLQELKELFVTSTRLWQHMRWVARVGSMWKRRDEVLIFHACVPVEKDGTPQTLVIDGREVASRQMMDVFDDIIRRSFRAGQDASPSDLDWLWYLWAGPRSPLFGKDKMATFESAFLADKHTHEEHKNAYFRLIHDADFVRRIASDFGVGPDVLLVNGHVPVKVDRGEKPIKDGGNAVTIDGAFSEAYGDRGYTLILAASGIELAEHHHFDSIEQFIKGGADIVPKIVPIRKHKKPRTVGETDRGAAARGEIEQLRQLITAYRSGFLQEQ
ncbi:MAG: fructose-bisphosphatase class III [Phycisphaerales bacterium]|nr:fructose-bisphosphatase class III [Phycisphaerales bacterium]